MRGAPTSRSRLGALLACAALVTACSSDPKPVYQEETAPQSVVTEYDASLEPSAAVLSLVPDDATSLTVTDFDQLRLVLGYGALDGDSSQRERDAFWRKAPTTAALSLGLLASADARLRADFGIGRDDVAWEATYAGDASGWVLAFHDSVPMAAVQRAVRAGVGPLEGAVVDADRHLVTSAAPPDGADSWGATEELLSLVGREAISTYVDRSCLDFDSVFGSGMEAQLAAAPKAALRALDELDAYSVALGAELVTVQLGPDRGDVFDRVRLADVMPPTDPDFGLVMSRGVADPSSGRLGYTLADAPAAAALTKARTLPFAVCRSLG
ncbi:hypothetical protein [Nocardioides aromaticivorans]|uniref:hypothetical protein n=1 Tax=Nocardioides aromaticivorans TaxID=200618 RepID=UPI001A8FD661|nr:hypothetical protein [Nocardioides aromaticivorans]